MLFQLSRRVTCWGSVASSRRVQMFDSRFFTRLNFRSGAQERANIRIRAQVLSDIGCHRNMNEDAACCIHPVDAALLRTKGVLAIVADGMGGHPSGDVASQIAIDTMTRTYYDSPHNAGRALRDCFSAANAAIREAANQREESRGMGAACTAFALLPGSAVFGHIGDTRLYSLRNGRLCQLTQDQTKVMRMVDQGLLSKEDARTHESRNVILQALGQRPSTAGAQWGQPLRTEVGDQFVLCSDGLYDLVRDHEILEAVLRHEPEDVCKNLISLAKSRGGFDNITVVVLRLVVGTDNARTTNSDSHQESPSGAEDN
jgi:PPM family protein phosphatase